MRRSNRNGSGNTQYANHPGAFLIRTLIRTLIRIPIRSLPCCLAFCVACSLLVGGCGFGHLQTAKTTPKGHIEAHAGMGYVHNHTIEMRSEKEEGSPIGFPNVPFVTGARLGVSDRIDIGLEMFFFAGMAADVKYNFMPPKNPFALSVLGGIGAADQVWAPTGAWVLNVPITLLASYDATDGIVPYAGVGYSTFWIFGREKEAVHSAGDLNERKGHGDGLLTLTAGVRFKIGDRVSIFLEYGYNLPVLDDPGDFFSFEDTHIALAGASVTFRVFGEPARRPVFPTPPPPPPPPPSPGPGPESPQPTI